MRSGAEGGEDVAWRPSGAVSQPRGPAIKGKGPHPGRLMSSDLDIGMKRGILSKQEDDIRSQTDGPPRALMREFSSVR